METSEAKFNCEDFYSYAIKKDFSSIKFILIFLAPYLIDLFGIFVATINLFLDSPIKIRSERIAWSSCFYQIIFILIIGILLFYKCKKKSFESDVFYYWLFLIVRFLQNLVKIVHVRYSKYDVLFEALNKLVLFITLFALTISFIYYIFYEHSFIRGIKSLFYKNAFIYVDGYYLPCENKEFSFEKFLFAIYRIFLWTLLSILIAVLVAKIFDTFSKYTLQNPPPSESQNNIVVKEKLKNPNTQFLTIFTVLIQAPILEELFFRHVLIRMSGNTTISIFFSSLLFAMAHINNEPITLLMQYMMPSLIFGFIYCKYRNIWFSILLHCLFNLNGLIHILLN